MNYEDTTFEKIQQRMLDRVFDISQNIDIREGSMSQNAVATEAVELSLAYDEISNGRNESFILTASRDGKIKKCQEIGIDVSVFNPTYGEFKAVFNVQVEIGSRWNLSLYNYKVLSYIGKNVDNNHEYRVVCETAGSAPNNNFGLLSPILEIPSGFSYGELTEVLIEGEDEISEDEINQYYLNRVNGLINDGNVAQYKQWCMDYVGVGNYKIFPLWNGENTVKVSILSASNDVASDELITEFQEYLDPCTIKNFVGDGTTKIFTITDSPTVIDMVRVNSQVKKETTDYTYSAGKLTFITAPSSSAEIEIRYNGGMGNGVAPIGAFVTVSTATKKTINISAKISLTDGYSDTTDIDNTIKEYFSNIAYKKEQVAYMALGAAILNSEAVNYITDLKINGGVDDISLGSEEIPELGTTDWTVVS